MVQYDGPVRTREGFPRSSSLAYDGHGGTHKFMVDDFCKAAYTGNWPPRTHRWRLRYNLPAAAYQSALRDGEPLEVPDCGNLRRTGGSSTVGEA